jgi:hypothetical protein
MYPIAAEAEMVATGNPWVVFAITQEGITSP